MTPDERRKLHTESNRGAEAANLLANPLLQDAFMAINRSIWNELAKVNVHDVEQIKALILMQKANQKLYRHLESVVKTGRMADMQIRTENAKGRTR